MDYSQPVRPRPRALTRSFVMLTMLVTTAASLLTAAEASASRYRWKNDADGNWNVAANWINVDGDPDGFPNQPGDIAILATLGAADRRITIPLNVTITVGQIVLGAAQTYTIFGDIDPIVPGRGRLAFNSGSAAAAEIANFGGADANVKLVAPVRLESALSVNVASTGRVEFIDGISQDMFDRLVTKTGPGTMRFDGRNAPI